jgi:3-isopropylmalate/(R)-2-methylmalate dehydratase small subunit
MKLQGKVWKFKDNIDTDVIIPARYLNTNNPKELAQHCMEDIDKDFTKKISQGDIIVAGKNFGCGSSREHAPIAIKAAGISCVIAESFARIFFRNSINTGLPIFESKQASQSIQDGNIIEIDAETGIIKNISKNETYPAKPLPEFMQKIISLGGLMEYIKQETTKQQK